MNLTRMAFAACMGGGALAACTSEVDWEPGYAGPGELYGFEDAGGGGTGPASSDGGIFGDGAASSAPMLARIDPNASMTQTPGQGVGVFAQYDSTSAADPGGHWYIWWTCDTTLSSLSCGFDVDISVAHGEITNTVAQGFGAGDTLAGAGVPSSPTGADAGAADGGASGSGSGTGGSTGSGSGSVNPGGNLGGPSVQGAGSFITAETTTTTSVQGVRFDTAPGAIITLSAAVGGEYSGEILFFVQDGKVNGGYQGKLTDPLELEPSSP